MKGLVHILSKFYIFVVQTHFYSYVLRIKNIHELTDRRRGASPSILQMRSHSECVCSDLSAVAQKTNQNVMQTHSESGNATASLLANINIPVIAQIAADISTKVGFVKQYFNYLPNYETALEAFQAVNVEYYLLHKHFKFASFQDFRKTIYKNA